jgi:ribulose-phosphate 3-epimerase
MTVRILASLSAADPAALGEAAERLAHAGVDGIHLDIADGHFVPWLSVGPATARALRARLPATFLDVHLMVENPEAYLDQLALGEGTRVTFHVEATRYPRRAITVGRRAGIASIGPALNPATPLTALDSVLDCIDFASLLSTEPDVDGERFIGRTVDRVRALRGDLRPDVALVVDGGVDDTLLPIVRDAGASDVVVGRAITGTDDWAAAVARLREAGG